MTHAGWGRDGRAARAVGAESETRPSGERRGRRRGRIREREAATPFGRGGAGREKEVNVEAGRGGRSEVGSGAGRGG